MCEVRHTVDLDACAVGYLNECLRKLVAVTVQSHAGEFPKVSFAHAENPSGGRSGQNSKGPGAGIAQTGPETGRKYATPTLGSTKREISRSPVRSRIPARNKQTVARVSEEYTRPAQRPRQLSGHAGPGLRESNPFRIIQSGFEEEDTSLRRPGEKPSKLKWVS